MGIYEEMKKHEDKRSFIHAEFLGKDGIELDIKADFVPTLALAMALLEQCSMADSKTTQSALLHFVRERLGEV